MSKTIYELAREIPITHEADLVVAGGGTAGVACAVCAARLGLSVIMIENSSHPGGMVTQVTQWSADFDNKGGFPKEFFWYMLDNKIMQPPYYNPHLVMPYFDRLLKEAGVKALYLCRAVAPIMKNKRLSGVIVESKQGRHAVKSKYVVDATGDGDIAAGAGADFEMGREKDGAVQSISLSHSIQNFQQQRLSLHDEIAPLLAKLSPDYKLPYDHGSLRKLTKTKSEALAALSHAICRNPLNVDDLSSAIIELRHQAVIFFELMKQTELGADWEFGAFSALPGIRESRRIVCDEKAIINESDIIQNHSSGLFTVNHEIDIHKCLENEPAIIVTKVPPFQIPYGALLPKGLKRLLVIGRCIDGDHEALASYRIISDCFAMGEAAALAVAQSLKDDRELRSIDVKILREKMIKLGYN